MRHIKYLLDEHVSLQLQKAIKHQAPEIVVWRIGDPGAPALGTLDPELLIWCENHDFILVTNNRHSMPIHLKDHLDAGKHIPGIFVINMNMGFGNIVTDLITTQGASDADEYADTIQFLPIAL